jgi:hypothetical protein
MTLQSVAKSVSGFSHTQCYGYDGMSHERNEIGIGDNTKG